MAPVALSQLARKQKNHRKQVTRVLRCDAATVTNNRERVIRHPSVRQTERPASQTKCNRARDNQRPTAESVTNVGENACPEKESTRPTTQQQQLSSLVIARPTAQLTPWTFWGLTSRAPDDGVLVPPPPTPLVAPAEVHHSLCVEDKEGRLPKTKSFKTTPC